MLKINDLQERKILEIWLTKAEKADPELNLYLKNLYKKYSSKKYLVAVFESGEKDLYQNTLDLLAFNKVRTAELNVMRAKA